VDADEQAAIVNALAEAGATLEYIKAMIETYVIDYHPNTVAKQTPFSLPAMIYAAACKALGEPVLATLLAANTAQEEVKR